ncbi:MAG: LVIVD repeat-containing protein [Planctomycetota bacterium]
MRKIHLFASSLALLLVLGGAAVAQGKNVALLGRFKKYSRYNDIWAYRAKNGKDYVLLGVSTGISVLDVSNPATPIERGFMAGTRGSSWRDVKVFGDYAYAVTENFLEGMMIIDLRNPDAPRLVKRWDPVGYRHAHNIAMDFKTGVAYLCGTSRGVVIIDIKTDPINPKVLAFYTLRYIHDLAIQDGFAHLADQNGPIYRILDISRLPTMIQLGMVRTPGSRVAHNTWPTVDNNYCLTTNEQAGGPVGIFDIKNKSAPRLVATYRANPTTAPSALPHNAYVVDRVMSISYYTEGWRGVDISDPTKPVEVGYYDTWSGASFGYNGNWGTLPALRSGRVYASDITSGLYILKPKATASYYGKGTAGTGGRLPRINAFGSGYLGNPNYRIEVSGAKPSSTAVLVIGGKSASVTVQSLNILVELVNPPAVVVPVPTSTTGKASLPSPVPLDTRLNGAVLYAQYFVLDRGSVSPIGLSASEGMKFELFSK